MLDSNESSAHGNRIAAPSRLGTDTTGIGGGFGGNSVGDSGNY